MSGFIKKITNPIVSAVGNAGQILASRIDTSPYEELISYYQNYDTSLADNTMKNLGTAAQNISGNLTDYITSIDGSDAARNEAQNAVFSSYQSLLEPEHERQTADLNARLLNQGLTVGSEAYQRAMNDLNQKQNLALNQAAYKAVTEGNDAFNQSFSQALQNAQLNNTARKNQLAEAYGYMDKATTGLDIYEKMFAAQNGLSAVNSANEQKDVQALLSLMGMVV
ncbi:MAG: hypothetical protein J6V53_04090 [Alphaproteobacteria bacterium]|nr:hypothetical protein [Alphaproteobacteria bacterium]